MDAKCPDCSGKGCEWPCDGSDTGIEISCETEEYGFRVRYGGAMEFSFLDEYYYAFSENFICLTGCHDGRRDGTVLMDRFISLCDMLHNHPEQFTTNQLNDDQKRQFIHATANIFTPSGVMTKGA